MKWFAKRYFKGSAHDEHLRNVKERKKAARIFAREYVWNYLTTHPCVQCGESDPRVLEFHHVGEKENTISHMVGDGYAVERIQKELDQTQVLCANCHRKLTMDERNGGGEGSDIILSRFFVAPNILSHAPDSFLNTRAIIL